jgi:hypothetical protein
MQDFVAPPNAGSISVGLSGIKQAIDLMARTWPGTVTRGELIRHAELTQGEKDAVSSEVLGEAVDELFEKLVLRGMAQIRLESVEAGASGDRPVIDPTVRRQIGALGPDKKHIVNAWHDSVEISGVERFLFPMMDGTQDQSALTAALAAALRDGRLQLSPVPSDLDAYAATSVAEMFRRFPESAVLLRQAAQ